MLKVVGTLLLAIGLLYGLAFGAGSVLDAQAGLNPAVQSALVDGLIFGVLGAALLLLDWFVRPRPPGEEGKVTD
jgi:hypothetical protein